MPTEKTIELRVDVLGEDYLAFMMNRKTAPAGVEVSGLMSDAMNSAGRDHAAFFFIVAIQLVGPLVAEVAKDAAKELAKDWLVEFLTKIKAKRIRIQGREPKDNADMVRIVSEEIEIGKND